MNCPPKGTCPMDDLQPTDRLDEFQINLKSKTEALKPEILSQRLSQHLSWRLRLESSGTDVFSDWKGQGQAGMEWALPRVRAPQDSLQFLASEIPLLNSCLNASIFSESLKGWQA